MSNYVEKGSCGGFTGASHSIRIYENGEIYKITKITATSPITSEFYKKIDPQYVNKLFKLFTPMVCATQLNQLFNKSSNQLSNQSSNQSSNMSSFMEYHINGKQYAWTYPWTTIPDFLLDIDDYIEEIRKMKQI